jgi:hypothetical protein
VPKEKKPRSEHLLEIDAAKLAMFGHLQASSAAALFPLDSVVTLVPA